MSVLVFWSVLLPIITGSMLLIIKKKSEKVVKALSLLSVVLTSLCVMGIILLCDDRDIQVIRFSETLSFSLKIDGLGKIFAGMVAVLWPFAMVYTFEYMKRDPRRISYYCFYVMTYGVVLGVAFASNALSLYVFYELLTFITLPLIIHTDTREARRAGRTYLYFSLTGSSLALAGIVIILVNTGSVSFARIEGIQEADRLSLFAYMLTFVGFGVKAAIFPLCRWLVRAAVAPTPTTALLHAVAVVKSGAFAIMRMTFFLFDPETLTGTWTQKAVILIAAFTVVYGSCMAVKEQHFKRRFAFSTISNLSYILLGTALATETGLEASLLHFLMHSATKIGIFFCIGAIIETNGVQYVYELNGMGKKAPAVFIAFTLCGLSLIGIPPFCGFISKYYLVEAFIEYGGTYGYIAAGAVICSAILTAFYVLSVSFRAFVREPNELSADHFRNAREPSKIFLTITWVFAVLSIVLGVFGGTITDLIERAV